MGAEKEEGNQKTKVFSAEVPFEKGPEVLIELMQVPYVNGIIYYLLFVLLYLAYFT